MFSKVLVCSCLLGFDDRLGLCRQGEGRGDKNMGEGTTPFLACSVLDSVSMSTEVTFEEKGLELCLLMEEGRNQARNHFFF